MTVMLEPASAASEFRTAHALHVIEPKGRWIRIDWAELWEFRELLGFLVWRDVKLRYKQTVLGAAWAVLQPLMTMVVFTVLFGRWARMPSDGRPYAVFAFAGLLPWTFFANALATASNSLVGNTHLLSKVYFPRLIIVLAPLGAGLLDLGISLAVMVGLMAVYHVPLTGQAVAIVPLTILVTALASGMGAFLAALCGMYRDFRYVVPFATQMWMFASPVIFPLSVVPAKWRWLFDVNPLAGIIDGFRSALLGAPFDPVAIGYAAVAAAIAVWGGFTYFHQVERRIADLL